MWWTAPTPRHRSAIGWLCRNANHIEGSRPWARLARSVWISPRTCFRFTVLMQMARWSFASVLAEREFLSSLPICRPAALGWKRAQRRISGHANSGGWDVKRGKNDAADAAAICEAVTRPSMRFVPIKDVEQQSVLMLHRARDLLIRQRTQLINALRTHLAELGLVAGKGREGLHQLVAVVTECGNERLPSNARFACQAIVTQLNAAQIEISGLDKRITQTHRANADSKRLDTIPGFGVILSTAVAATMADPKAFRTGRDFAAWIGLVPRQNSTGGKERLGSISKQGDRYLRRLLVVGATSVINCARARPYKYPWVIELLGRRPTKVVAVALANKMARIAWAVLTKGEPYRSPTRSSNAVVPAAA